MIPDTISTLRVSLWANTRYHKQKPISSKKFGWRFCQDFWCKIYAQGGGLYNLDQNLMALIFTKTVEHYLC